MQKSHPLELEAHPTEFRREPHLGHASARGVARWSRLMVSVGILGALALLAWTSLGGWKLEPIGPRQLDYYNLLVSGFRKGSLALDLKVPDTLKAAENPWDPGRRPQDAAPHDVSYYNGHFYLYFGVVPAVLLFWPFRALTGHDLPFVYSCIVYSWGGFLVIAWLWLRIVRDQFPGASLVTRIGGLLAVGLAGGQLVLARRCSMWEMPIAAGYFYMACTMASGYLALQARRPWAWLAVAGTALGLAVGSRPTLLAAGAGLAALGIAVGSRQFAPFGRPERLRRTAAASAAAGIPLALIFGALLAYNKVRFGSFTEFGLNYQLTAVYERLARHFSPTFIPFNFSVYFLQPPQWGRYFPFLHPISAPPKAADYYGYEFVYGSLVICPVLWWAFGIVGSYKSILRRFVLTAFVATAAATAVATTLLLLCFNTAAARYTVDFMPWWVWLAALGWAAFEANDNARMRLGRAGCAWARLGFAATAGLSLVLSFCASVELHGLFQFWNPTGYRQVARVFDAPVAAAERLAGTVSGPIDMTVTFARRPIESYEPLVVTGVEYQTDYVFIFYQSDTVIRLGYSSDAGGGVATSPDINIVPGRPYRLHIETGALYPPDSILFYTGWKTPDIDSVKSWVRLEMDGVPVLVTRKPWNDPAPGTLRLGYDTRDRTFGTRFAGAITSVSRRLGPSPFGDMSAGGDLRFQIEFPDGRLWGNQPLATAGRKGNADILGLSMPDADHFALVYESWGSGKWESSPVALPKNRDVALRVRLGPLLHLDDASPQAILRRTVAVWADETPIGWFRTRYALNPGSPLGLISNNVESSVVEGAFLGRVKAASCDPAPPTWRSGPMTALELDLAGRGSGSVPLITVGAVGRSDALSLEWLPGGKGRLIYQHLGHAPVTSAPFAWNDTGVHRLRLELPSFATLDAPLAAPVGRSHLGVEVDGAAVFNQDAEFFPSQSKDLLVCRSIGQPLQAALELPCVVVGLRQILP